MKIENKFAYIIIFFITVNLIYYKIAKDIQKENLKIISNSFNYQNQPSQNLALLTIGENLIVEFRNELTFIDQDYAESDKEKKETTLDMLNNSKKLLYKENDGIMAEIGDNVNDGLIPIPIPQSNKMLTAEPDKGHLYEPEARYSHLTSFLIILGILTFISLVLVAMQEFQRRTEFDIFNMHSIKTDDYYLLSDRG